MRIPISAQKDLSTGETTYQYIEINEKVLTDFFEQKFDKFKQTSNN